ncbi:glucoamylase family protein [Parasegetibacter sp. NRK P23]|uniref:glucoamylase family protein n=1 Tax=Parasegetibacter sp. NRK P23 TaxID=2942999 RepID=UPI0020442E6F|nr:glucoamylase family protein [Parasegetibacter sp. NRK P23]MCM5527866.1 Ig-like domain-containing protein [Parasegetibacter sp. NRK P23]
MKRSVVCVLIVAVMALLACGKKEGGGTTTYFDYRSATINGLGNGTVFNNTSLTPEIRMAFSAPVAVASLPSGIVLRTSGNQSLAIDFVSSGPGDVVTVKPEQPLQPFTRYTLSVTNALKGTSGALLRNPVLIQLGTGIDSSDKFPRISSDQLLTLVQQQTFKYFWDFGHPVSGMARERNTSGDLVTSGGSGFGAMAIVTGVSRGFITRQQGVERLQKMVGFLKNTVVKYHGAFPHWINGNTGATIPFSAKDDGADLVETALLMQGLLTARQFFNGADAGETTLRNDINTIWNGIEWNWFRKNNEDVLYWHWSPNFGWEMNLPIKGWNESLIVYALAAASTTHTIPKSVYDAGWAGNGAMRNGQTYFETQLPLGPAFGGPLFFSHYSFLGINPNGLSDTYARYDTQNVRHARINYQYCISNPKNYYGYSADCWGLTASDIPSGYSASSPANDLGVIAPTAALASFPYTPEASMKALEFFYYKLGDKLWKEYGFVDAFSLNEPWFANSFLAIDQGPIIIMIENYRTGLLWDLFMSAPEVKAGLKKLGFSAPGL